MKKLTALFLVCVCACLILASCDSTSAPVSSEAPTSPVATNTPSPKPSATPSQPTPQESVTPGEVTPTNRPTLTPEDTPTPTLTPTPTPTPTPPVEPEVVPTVTSGSFSSDTGTYLNIVCDWNVEKNADGKYELTVKVDLSHYSLYVTKRVSSYTVGNQNGTFNTPDIRIDPEAGKQLTYFTTVKYVLSENEIKNGVPFTVTWVFNGVYSGKPIQDVVASTVIQFN